MKRTIRGLAAVALAASIWTASDAQAQVRFRGVITAVGDQGVALHTDRGDVRVWVTEHTRIMRDGILVRLPALQPGDRAAVSAEETDRGLVALAINARSENPDVFGVRGAVAEVGEAVVVLRTRRGPLEIHVTDRTEIFRNGERVRLAALQVGDHARALVERTDRGLLGISIQAFGEGVFVMEGVVAGVGDGVLLLHTRRGDAEIHVTAETEIYRNGERVRLPALQRGDLARAMVQRTDRGLLGIRVDAHGG
ncbi:MAG: hypothetical protein IT449_14700 [Phycisphaerales bacterium]|nr:hypothetical protein [Phycisphaerales bacterium]